MLLCSCASLRKLAACICMLAILLPPTAAQPVQNCTDLNTVIYGNAPLADKLAGFNPSTLCPEHAATYEILRQQIMKQELLTAASTRPSTDAAADIPSTTQNSSNPTSEEEWPYRGNDLIPLYCGCMGSIILSSIIYAVIKQRKLYAHKRISKTNNENCSYKQEMSVNSPASGLLTPTKSHLLPTTASDVTHTASPLLAPVRPHDSCTQNYLLGELRIDHSAVQLEDS